MKKNIVEQIKKIYEITKKMPGEDVKYEEDTYHRDFLHISQALDFIDSHNKIHNYNSLEEIFKISMLLHDISNLYAGHDKHEYKIVFEIIESEESLGIDSKLSLQIKEIYNYKPVLVKSLKAKRIQRLARKFIKDILSNSVNSDIKFYFDTVKIFILATDFSYIKFLSEDQNELTDNFYNQILLDKTIPNKEIINKIILKEFKDEEYKNFLEFFISNEKLLNLLKVYKKTYVEKLSNPEYFIHYIRFADLSPLFSLEKYIKIENQLTALLINDEEHFKTQDIESQKTELFRVNSSQLKLLLNILIFNLRLSNLGINLLNEEDFIEMESLLSLLSSKCWKYQ